MGKRTNKIRHDEQTRNKIQAAQIINRFHKCLMGEVELTATQVSAGKTLLNKVLPDLKAMELTGPEGGALQHDHNIDASKLSDQALEEIINAQNAATDES